MDAERRDTLEDVHGVAVLGRQLQNAPDSAGQLEQRVDFGPVLRELIPIGQTTPGQQVRHLLEYAVLSQVLDGKAAVHQAMALLAYGRNRGFSCNDTCQAF